MITFPALAVAVSLSVFTTFTAMTVKGRTYVDSAVIYNSRSATPHLWTFVAS